MIVALVVAAVVVAYAARLLLAKRARERFCHGDCVTLALRLKPNSKGTGWRHGFAVLGDDTALWRAEHKLGAGADLTLDRLSLIVREHRLVVKGETMLSDRCEIVFAHYQGEPVELGVPLDEAPRLLSWVQGG